MEQGDSYFFDDSTNQIYNWWSKEVWEKDPISAPIQSELQDWLRDTHNIHIHIIHHDNEYSGYVNNEVVYIHFKSHEDALEACLFKALKLIIN